MGVCARKLVFSAQLQEAYEHIVDWECEVYGGPVPYEV